MNLVNPYCSVAQVREYIRNNDTGIEDALVTAVNAASRFIDQYKRQDFIEHDYSTDPFVIDKHSDLIFRDSIYLRWPVIEITSIQTTDDRKPETRTLVEGEDWRLVDASKVVNLKCDWPYGHHWHQSVIITGRFGYAQRNETGDLDPSQVPAGIPANINQACVQIAAALSRHNTKEVVGLDGQKMSITETDIPKTAMALLGPRSRILV